MNTTHTTKELLVVLQKRLGVSLHRHLRTRDSSVWSAAAAYTYVWAQYAATGGRRGEATASLHILGLMIVLLQDLKLTAPPLRPVSPQESMLLANDDVVMYRVKIVPCDKVGVFLVSILLSEQSGHNNHES